MTKFVFSQVQDGGTLRKLPTGLEIVRRKKHEPIHLKNLSSDELARLTGKVFGSKFVSAWKLKRVVEFIEKSVQSRGWSLLTGPASMIVEPKEITGFANGKVVAAIRIVSDGRYVHAYPVEF